MAQFIIMTDELMEAHDERLIQKFIALHQSHKEDPPENIGSQEAKKLLSEIWGVPVSDSWIEKKSMLREIPFVKRGKFRVFNRMELLAWAKAQIARPRDPVSESIVKSARRRVKAGV